MIQREYTPEKGTSKAEPSHYKGPDDSMGGWKKFKPGQEQEGVLLTNAKYISRAKLEELAGEITGGQSSPDKIFKKVESESCRELGGHMLYELEGRVKFSRAIAIINPPF